MRVSRIPTPSRENPSGRWGYPAQQGRSNALSTSSSEDASGPWGYSAKGHSNALSRVVFEWANIARSRRGLVPLKPDPKLARAAGIYSANMIAGDFFGHSDPKGKTFRDRVKAFGLGVYERLEENIFASEGRIEWVTRAQAKQVLQKWASKGSRQRQTILDPSLTVAGVGVALREGRYTVVMILGK